MAELIFLTGPTRSGKSHRAVEIAKAWGENVVFVATYRSDASDAEMAERVRRHRAERMAAWRTLEAPADIAQALADLRPTPSGALIDSMTLWLADRLDQDDGSLIATWERQLDGFCAAPHPVIVVGDEIGWSPVPMDKELRRFRDLVGLLGQRTASRASEAWLMVAGCGVRLK
ncbi:bifunctional adenosylcobinamide kinase/adenosylcobinamide-phosphate guanylyltransferase [Bradyrhizobium canariense]|uniref:Bifunctional adenosylcobalamin biosynthesis protein n=1 Tax=Bradyrhizobium canariense TaxID=255045 RepID=A0A1H1X7J7_9BRAD|nr:bifunctional adenosylcobinamide kinase/adenosylcobinamide-phosphate guanylyltransferase [Bradyrhizobium canariense]SDT05172.1 adenosylcobinamide kinase /adenosylcobinamide-phosphate guanylyltransferase [Bradyrhizobium canariense]